MEIKIALVGNPNSGKTTMFNDLTGSNQHVGNWPGVTVEKKEGKLKGYPHIIIQDLPGIYSLSPYTLEEVITRNYLIKEKPDAIINIIDGTNIERNLYLTTQLIELGIPVIIALNMIDLVRKNGDKINSSKLSYALGYPVIETSALKGIGSLELTEQISKIINKPLPKEHPIIFNRTVEHAIAHIEESIENKIDKRYLRWYAIKLFERDEKVAQELDLAPSLKSDLEEHIIACEKEMDDDPESIITSQRYFYISKLLSSCLIKKEQTKISASDRIDKIVTNRILALPIFMATMFLVYYISISTVGDILTGFTNDTLFGEWISSPIGGWMEIIGIAPWLTGLVVDGIIGGVGAVLGFVPQMLVLFLMLCLLEEVGYMSRVAFIMDRLFRRFGLSGKSFIPMLIGSGCAIPGIMASRTIENERDRRMTIMTTSFIPCGAKMPIVALIAGALFGGSGLVATSAYFIGIIAIILSGIILKKTKPFSGDPAPFIMELPPYHLPKGVNILRATWERGWSFIKRAGTIILVSAIILWFLQAFGVENGSLTMVEDNNTSLLANIGGFIAPLFAPLGFGSWQATVGTITGLIAKENVVGTLGILYGFSEVAENGAEYWSLFASDFTALTVYSFMVFNLLCAPCFAAMGAIYREMNSKKWTWATIGYLTAFAYVTSLMIYQFGMLFSGARFSYGTLVAIIFAIILLWLLFRKNKNENLNTNAIKKEEYFN